MQALWQDADRGDRVNFPRRRPPALRIARTGAAGAGDVLAVEQQPPVDGHLAPNASDVEPLRAPVLIVRRQLLDLLARRERREQHALVSSTQLVHGATALMKDDTASAYSSGWLNGGTWSAPGSVCLCA